MKKYALKNIIVLLLLLSVSCFFCSCEIEAVNDSDDDFLLGVEHGKNEMFLALFNAIAMKDEKQLSSGETWNTKDFTLTLNDTAEEGKRYLNYSLTLKDMTIKECCEQGSLFFTAYSLVDNGDWKPVLSYDGYIWYSTEDIETKKAQGKALLPSDDSNFYMSIIIIFEGTLYNAAYLY